MREKRSRASPAIPPHPLPLSQSERGESPNDVITTLAAIRENAKVQGGGGKKAWPSEDIYESFRDAAAELRGLIDQTQKRLAFEAEAARPAAETALRLLAVCDGVAAAYEAEKRDLAALDFDDLLIRARDLLLGPNGNELRNRLAAQIKLLLVDEFQDTDPLQVELLRALCDGRIAGGKLFLVGDYKQSIYRFRGADPEVFKQLRREIPRDGRLSLSRNFRSQPAVLDFINALFCSELRDNGEDGEEAEDYEPLVADRTIKSPPGRRSNFSGQSSRMKMKTLATQKFQTRRPRHKTRPRRWSNCGGWRPIGSPGGYGPCWTPARRSCGMKRRPLPVGRRPGRFVPATSPSCSAP